MFKMRLIRGANGYDLVSPYLDLDLKFYEYGKYLISILNTGMDIVLLISFCSQISMKI